MSELSQQYLQSLKGSSCCKNFLCGKMSEISVSVGIEKDRGREGERKGGKEGGRGREGGGGERGMEGEGGRGGGSKEAVREQKM